MRRTRVCNVPEFREVVYSEDRWRLLDTLRARAIEIMRIFMRNGLEVWLHGSVARGDVWEKSDVDIVIPRRTPAYIVEYVLERADIKPFARYIVVATPTSTPKGVITLDGEERFSVSFPLTDYKPLELEFYKFGGYLSYSELLQNKRCPGVNKQLLLIIPTQNGHLEAPVVGYEDYVAKVLGVSVNIVRERVEILTRRDEVGRTGVYAELVLAPSESFEEGLERLLKERPVLRRVLADLL